MVTLTEAEEKDATALLEKANDSAAAKLGPEEMYFAELIHNGWSQSAAYIKAHPRSKMNRQSASVTGNRLAKQPRIQAYLDRLKSGAAKSLSGSPMLAACLERDAKRVILAEVISDSSQDITARLRAIEIDNRMAGHDAPRVSVALTGPLSVAKTLLDRYAQRRLPAGDQPGGTPPLASGECGYPLKTFAAGLGDLSSPQPGLTSPPTDLTVDVVARPVAEITTLPSGNEALNTPPLPAAGPL